MGPKDKDEDQQKGWGLTKGMGTTKRLGSNKKDGDKQLGWGLTTKMGTNNHSWNYGLNVLMTHFYSEASTLTAT